MSSEKHELTISHIIKAPLSIIWKAWLIPEYFEKWWIPQPIVCKVIKMDLKVGGGFETEVSKDGGIYQPHLKGCFLEVVPQERIVFTTALIEDLQPAESSLAITVIITMQGTSSGTLCTIRVKHKNSEDISKHLKLGFNETWTAILVQLAKLAERMM